MKSEYKNPPYLYHYTSIETLALILKNKTIRFNRLDLVDDPEECETKDFGKIGRFFFVSCWMSDEEESIPMWKMYSNDLKGVRVKLPTFPFKKYVSNDSNTKRQNSDANTTIHVEDLSKPLYSFINFENFQEFNVTTIPLQEDILKKIEYTEDENLLYPRIYQEKKTVDGYEKNLNLNCIGKYKRLYWKFQQEYRYIFYVTPWSKDEILNSDVENHKKIFDRLKEDNISHNYFDLELDENSFNEMTITLGPKSTGAEYEIVKLLTREYNPKAEIIISKIKIR